MTVSSRALPLTERIIDIKNKAQERGRQKEYPHVRSTLIAISKAEVEGSEGTYYDLALALLAEADEFISTAGNWSSSTPSKIKHAERMFADDIEALLTWAADRGYVLAQIKLGDFYFPGRTFLMSKWDVELAKAWIQKAASQGNEDAILKLLLWFEQFLTRCSYDILYNMLDLIEQYRPKLYDASPTKCNDLDLKVMRQLGDRKLRYNRDGKTGDAMECDFYMGLLCAIISPDLEKHKFFIAATTFNEMALYKTPDFVRFLMEQPPTRINYAFSLLSIRAQIEVIKEYNLRREALLDKMMFLSTSSIELLPVILMIVVDYNIGKPAVEDQVNAYRFRENYFSLYRDVSKRLKPDAAIDAPRYPFFPFLTKPRPLFTREEIKTCEVITQGLEDQKNLLMEEEKASTTETIPPYPPLPASRYKHYRSGIFNALAAIRQTSKTIQDICDSLIPIDEEWCDLSAPRR